MWTIDSGVKVLIVSSTVYNEAPSEPTVIVVSVFETEPDAGFGVGFGPELLRRIKTGRQVTKVTIAEVDSRIDGQAHTMSTTCYSRFSRRRKGTEPTMRF